MEKGGETITSSSTKKGAWSPEEDRKLTAYINRYGIWNWNYMAKPAGLARTGKSCRLRWMNYLKPGVRHGKFTKEEEDTIIKWHQLLGNKWSMIASKLEGRTDNEIKNYWHTRIKKRVNNEATDHNSTPNSESELGSLLDYTMQDEFWGEDDRKSVNNGTDVNTTSPCTNTTESVWPLDYSLQNEVDGKLVADDVFNESSSSGISAEHHNIWEQLPSLDDMLMEADFGITSIVPGSFTLPYSLQESLAANEYHLIYDDLWGSSYS